MPDSLDPLLSARQQRELAIARQAQAVALAACPEGRVEPEAIAAREGIGFRYAEFPEDFDGILLHEEGRYYIVCNERRARRGTPRSRFTFAHELGHYFLGDHREALASGKMPAHFSLADFVSQKPVEREADLFAANLLMPFARFCDLAESKPRGLAAVAELAEHFGTSITATAFRALDADLFPEPAAVLRFDLAGELLGRRMSWATFTRGSRDRQLTATLPAGTVSAQAVTEGCVGIRRGPTDCLTWFDDLLYADDPANLPLQEEVMSLGQYGYLTLVYRTSG
jgi:hypothetical protein